MFLQVDFWVTDCKDNIPRIIIQGGLQTAGMIYWYCEKHVIRSWGSLRALSPSCIAHILLECVLHHTFHSYGTPVDSTRDLMHFIPRVNEVVILDHTGLGPMSGARPEIHPWPQIELPFLCLTHIYTGNIWANEGHQMVSRSPNSLHRARPWTPSINNNLGAPHKVQWPKRPQFWQDPTLVREETLWTLSNSWIHLSGAGLVLSKVWVGVPQRLSLKIPQHRCN